MNRRIWLLNLALACLVGILVWQLRLRRAEAAAQQRLMLDKRARAQAVLAPPAPQPAKPIAPAEYIDTAQKLLFSKDRNPNVIVDVPPPPPPPPPPPVMPPLPFYYGQLHFGGPAVIELRLANGKEQKGYQVGDKIGDFTLVSFDSGSVTFEWNGDQIVRKVTDLKPKDERPVQAAAAGAPAAAKPAANNGVIAIGANASDAANANAASQVPPEVGADIGGGFYACKSGDSTPSGTVISGYKKTSTTGLMGTSCGWQRTN